MRSRLVTTALAALAFTALAAPSAAQTPTPTHAPARTPRITAPPTPVATPTAAQVAAAHALFKALKLEESISNTAAAMVESEIAHNPGLAPYRDIMLAWLRKYMTWDAMEPELTRLYADTYTEGEMKALAMFYSSPVGQKSVVKTPELLSKTAAIGARISQAHTPELNDQLTARRDELKAQSAARTPGAGAGAPTPAAPPPTTAAPKKP